MDDMRDLGGARDLAAGDFGAWLGEVRVAIRREGTSDVPCGTCTACCTSSQFVHIAPDETDTLAHIPAELLFTAPGLPRGYLLLGYDERGHCPMLIDGACSIYEHRPLTCRAYDCRVFPAAGIDADDDKPLIASQTNRWRFAFATDDDRARWGATRAAAAYLRDHRDLIGDVAALPNATRHAVLAIEIHEVFLGHDDRTGALTVIDPGPDAVRLAVRSCTGSGGAEGRDGDGGNR
jgi:Fe-S-cluster containining protein